ncbi:MAG: flagellar hook-length control protein FliK [Oligoflexia bacterium]|nr:flagellar hook-length control protein FliK [Oligoflexia bacterium]
MAAELSKPSSGSPAARKLKGEESEPFASELMGAAAAQNAQLPQQAPQLPASTGQLSAEALQLAAKKPEPAVTAAAKPDEAPGTKPGQLQDSLNAKQPRLETKSADSMKAAAAIAGLKPWSKEWVFEGADRNPDLKPLFGEEKPGLLQAMAARISRDERARGEAEKALTGLDGAKPAPEAVKADGTIPSLQALQGNVAADELVSRHLRELEGEITGQRLGAAGAGEELPARLAVTAGKSLVPGDVHGRGSAGAGLSGAEFMSALSAVRNGASQGQSGMAGRQESGNEAGSGRAPELKVIEGGLKGRKTALKDELFAGTLQSHAVTGRAIDVATAPAMPQVTGHVVPGAMSRERLSTESLAGMSAGIRNLTPQGGGEMRVRLNPDHLGELHVRVVTQGNNVGLTIHASDEKARKIIEESLSHLKESLATQKLSLGQVDVTTIGSVQQSAFSGETGDSQSRSQNQQHQQAFGDFGGFQDPSRGNGAWSGGQGAGRWSDSALDERGGPQVGIRPAGTMTAATAARGAGTNGRLDVRA